MTAVRKFNRNNNNRKSHLKVVRGGQHPLQIREKRMEQFWTFCHATLWNTREFSQDEVREFKKLIAEHFKTSRNTDQQFLKLVQRVCLVKRYLKRGENRYIAKPMDWLNINYQFGLVGTESWMKQVDQQRKTVPHYNEGISTLADAVLNYCEKRNLVDVVSFRKKLIEQKQYDLIQMYLNTILHLHFGF